MTTDTTNGTVATRLAEAATDLAWEDVPPDVVDIAKLLVLDQLGLQVRGSTLRHVQPQRRLVEESGGRPESRVTGTSLRTTAAQAAYVNGTFGHSMEFDDCHLSAWHAGSVIVPAGLAVAERERRSGRDLLLALVAGHQVMCVTGSVCTPEMLKRGWHGPKVVGGFAAAAVSARLLNLPSSTLAHAFGIAASDSSGTMQYDQAGGEVKRLHAGAAARSGIEAAALAAHGLTGPPEIFEGTRGVFSLFGACAAPTDLVDRWAKWHMRDTMFRLNPGVGTVLPALDIVAALKRENSFDWRDVIDVEVGLRSFAVGHGGAIVHPTDGISAHFSLAFALALRIVTGASAPEDYVDPAAWQDPAITKISTLVRAVPHEFDDGMPLLSARVTIRLADGRSLSGEQGGFRGGTEQPAHRDELVAKFRANVAVFLTESEAQALLDLVDHLDGLPDVGRITTLLAGRLAQE